MERYEVEDDGRLSALIDAARRGDEVVVTQGGEPVATVVPGARRATDRAAVTPPAPLRTRDGGEPRRGIDWAALDALHAGLPPGIRSANTAALISEMRDMDIH